MGQKSGLFNSSGGDRQYGDMFWATVFSLISGKCGYMSGIENELEVVDAGTGLEATVKSGAAWLGIPSGWWYVNDSDLSLNFNAEVGENDRIDRVVVRLDRTTEVRAIFVEVLEGTASVSPVPKTLTQDESIFEISLAQVYITGGSSAITITDERNTEFCGKVVINRLTNSYVYKTSAFTIASKHENAFINVYTASNVAVTIPTHANDPIPLNTDITLMQYGTGTFTLTPASGVTLCSKESNKKSDGQYSAVTIRKIAADIWIAVGALTS